MSWGGMAPDPLPLSSPTGSALNEPAALIGGWGWVIDGQTCD